MLFSLISCSSLCMASWSFPYPVCMFIFIVLVHLMLRWQFWWDSICVAFEFTRNEHLRTNSLIFCLLFSFSTYPQCIKCDTHFVDVSIETTLHDSIFWLGFCCCCWLLVLFFVSVYCKENDEAWGLLFLWI